MKKSYLLILIFIVSLTNLSAQSPKLYGSVTYGGINNSGTIFNTDINGQNHIVLDTFDVASDGSRPGAQKLLEVAGKLYGVTERGGDNDRGVLFEYNPLTNAYITKHHFKDSTGSYPNCYLLSGSNGKIYGSTTQGGVFNRGVFFEYDITTNVVIAKNSFNSLEGYRPIGQMVETTPGIIYGVCQYGGANSNGTIYEYSITNDTVIKKGDFNNTVNGRNPQGGLMKANNGKLYGSCYSGGTSNYGTLYEFNLTTLTITKKADFNGLNGRLPRANLIQAANGKLYGTTYYGGSATSTGRGTIFEFNIATDSLKKIHTISYTSTSRGYYLYGGLLENTPGKFLLTMYFGGLNLNSGVISEYTLATNTMTDRVHFDKFNKGNYPVGDLVKSSITGKFYGMCNSGGTGENGVVFEYDDVLDTLLKKKDLSPSLNGKYPTNNLLHASNGNLYGITSSGGNGSGVIFEVNIATNTIIKRAEFDRINGAYPRGSLVEINGKIYGTTNQGGDNDRGVLYEFDLSTNMITKLQDLQDFNMYNPISGLIEATNGKLYGTTLSGGSLGGSGTLFEYDITLDTLIEKGNFGIYNKGRSPYGRLLQATNGKIYGTCNYGGDYLRGTVYEYDFISDSIKSLISFNDTNGAYPRGGLIQTSTGKLYGVTPNGFSSTGTTNGYGILYEFDITSNLIVPRAYYDRYTSGYGGYGELLEASNGYIYGISRRATGTFNGARVVEFNPINNNFISKSFLDGTAEGGLIEVGSSSTSINENKKVEELLIYPNPTNFILNIDTKGEKIESVKIFTISGQLINSTLNSNNTIDVSHLKSGLYIIQVETNKGIALTRFIKK